MAKLLGSSVIIGVTGDEEVNMNVVGVRRAIDANHPFSGNVIRYSHIISLLNSLISTTLLFRLKS